MNPDQVIREALLRYERPLISFALGITGDIESAKDAVQETFLRLSRQDVAAIRERLAPWLFFVCRNCALDHRRKVVHFPSTGVTDDLPDGSDPPDVAAVRMEETERLRCLVNSLPEGQRDLIRLKFEAGLSYREMSEVTRTSVSSVGVQLHNAMSTLRRLWTNTEKSPAHP